MDIYSLLAGVNANNPATSAGNPTFAQSNGGLFTPGGISAMDSAIPGVGGAGPGLMDVALARAAGAGGAGPISAGLNGLAGGGALVPYSADAAAAATNPLVAALRNLGIGTAPHVLPPGTNPIAMPQTAGGAAVNTAGAGAEAGELGMLGEAANTPGLFARMLGGNLPGLSMGGRGLGGTLKTFLRGTPATAADEAAGTLGTEAVGGALNPYAALGMAAPMVLNATLPSSKGRQVAADAGFGLGAGAGLGAGIGALGGPVGSAVGAGVGALAGGLYGLLHNGPKPLTETGGESQLAHLFDAARLDQQARGDILSQFQTAWAMAQGNHAQEKALVQQAMQLVPQERASMVDRMAQQLSMQQYLPSIQSFMGPTIDHMNGQAQNTFNLATAEANKLPTAQGAYIRASALQQLADVQNQSQAYETAMAFYPLMQQLTRQNAAQTSVDNSAQRKALAGASSTSGSNQNYAAAIATALNGG